MPQTGLSIGVDLGGTKIAAGAVAADGTVAHSLIEPTDAGSAGKIVGQVVRIIAELERSCPTALERIGVATAGLIEARTGKVIFSPNLPLSGIQLMNRLKEGTGREVLVENDANAGAVAEHLFGAGRGSTEMVMITVGTGIGGGIIAGGRLYRGSIGTAGEIGHMVVDPSGPKCGCGRFGCLEAVASGTALVAWVKRRIEAGRRSLLEPGTEITGQGVAAAARKGDELAMESFQRVGSYLGLGLANIAGILDPQVIVIGGGLAETEDLLLDPTKAAMREGRPPGLPEDTAVVAAALGWESQLVGASSLARTEADQK